MLEVFEHSVSQQSFWRLRTMPGVNLINVDTAFFTAAMKKYTYSKSVRVNTGVNAIIN